MNQIIKTTMAKIYADLVRKKKKEIEDVPTSLKEEVKKFKS